MLNARETVWRNGLDGPVNGKQSVEHFSFTEKTTTKNKQSEAQSYTYKHLNAVPMQNVYRVLLVKVRAALYIGTTVTEHNTSACSTISE